LDDDKNNVEAMLPPPPRKNKAARAMERGNGKDDDDSDYRASDAEDDEIIEMKVKSHDTLIREKYNAAVRAGNVHSLTSTTTAVPESSSMRSTFSSISSSITAMRSGNGRLQERRVMLAAQSAMISYDATLMVLDAGHDKFKNAKGENNSQRNIQLSMHPFAQGGLRNVYRMKQRKEPQQVAKESRHDIKYQERLKFHVETSKCQAQAAKYAKAFNKRVKKLRKNRADEILPNVIADWSPVSVLRAEVYRLDDTSSPGGFRYLAVEAELKGEYKKWNSNNGYVNPAECRQCQVAQAFR